MAEPQGRGRNRHKGSRSRVQRALEQRDQALKRTGRSFSSDAQKGFEKRNAQFGTGRLGSRSDSRRHGGRSKMTRRKGKNSRDRSRFGRERSEEVRGREKIRSKDGKTNGKTHPHAQRLLDKRLMQIEKMRDLGVKNDNANMLRQADHLEEIARRQFAQRTNATTETTPDTSGERSESDSVTRTRRPDDEETTVRRIERKRRFNLDIFGLFRRRN